MNQKFNVFFPLEMCKLIENEAIKLSIEEGTRISNASVVRECVKSYFENRDGCSVKKEVIQDMIIEYLRAEGELTADQLSKLIQNDLENPNEIISTKSIAARMSRMNEVVGVPRHVKSEAGRTLRTTFWKLKENTQYV